MADGDVALHGEGGDGAGGRVDPQVLEISDPQAARVPEHPLPVQGVGDVGQPGCGQDHQVSRGQAHQVTVGGSPHVFGGQHHQDHHHVPHDAHPAYKGHQKHADHFVLNCVVSPNTQGLVVLQRRVVLHSHVLHGEVLHDSRSGLELCALWEGKKNHSTESLETIATAQRPQILQKLPLIHMEPLKLPRQIQCVIMQIHQMKLQNDSCA